MEKDKVRETEKCRNWDGERKTAKENQRHQVLGRKNKRKTETQETEKEK